jgi:hypothetical protein
MPCMFIALSLTIVSLPGGELVILIFANSADTVLLISATGFCLGVETTATLGLAAPTTIFGLTGAGAGSGALIFGGRKDEAVDLGLFCLG